MQETTIAPTMSAQELKDFADSVLQMINRTAQYYPTDQERNSFAYSANRQVCIQAVAGT